MVKVAQLADNVRSKNAGPFWLTIDIFCSCESSYKKVCIGLKNSDIAKAFKIKPTLIKRFEIDSLNVLKISLPRPFIQGSAHDTDMHGASWAELISELDIK